MLTKAKRNFPLKETASIEQVLKHLRMIRDGKLVNSALLAFTTDPQSILCCTKFLRTNITL